MYDITRKTELKNVTVKELIDILNKFPQDAEFCICGDNYGWIHVEEDDSVVSIDTNELEDEYPEDVYDDTVTFECGSIGGDIIEDKITRDMETY